MRSWKIFKKYHWKEIEDFVVIIDIDSNEVHWRNSIAFPTPQTDYWRTKLENLSSSIDKLPEYQNDDYINLSDQSNASIKCQIMINLEINMKIKKLFINLIILLLGNYAKHYTKDKNDIFDHEGYLASVPSSNKPFYEKFSQTQIFNTFIKRSQQSSSFEIMEFKNYMKIIFSK